MTDISFVSIEDLKREIERRERIISEKPAMKESPDFSDLRTLCQKYVDDPEEDEDMKDYIFEGAVTALFGDDVWEYIREVTA